MHNLFGCADNQSLVWKLRRRLSVCVNLLIRILADFSHGRSAWPSRWGFRYSRPGCRGFDPSAPGQHLSNRFFQINRPENRTQCALSREESGIRWRSLIT